MNEESKIDQMPSEGQSQEVPSTSPEQPVEKLQPVQPSATEAQAPESSSPSPEGQPQEAAAEEIVKPVKKRAAPKKKAPREASQKNGEEMVVGLPGKYWYVIHTLSGQENKVKENMESRLQSEEMADVVTQVLIPTENVSEVKSGKKTVTTRKFFPGYVLVNMELNEKSWYFIRNTSGVIGFIGTGKPVPLQDHEVAEILSQIEEKKEKVKPKVMFDVGENVKVNDGPFVNFTGTVEEVNPDRGKLKVMVSIFGRATPIELEYWQVERS